MCSLPRLFGKLSKCNFIFHERNRIKLLFPSSQLSTKSVKITFKAGEWCLFEMCHPSLASVYLSRSFAKSRDKVKKGSSRVTINEQELSELFDVDKLKEDFGRPLSNLKRQYVEQLSMRTSPGTIENIRVKFDGDMYTIQDLAEVRKKSPKEIILEMGTFMDAIPIVMDALRNSALGLNPLQEGNNIIVIIPQMTREQREQMAKGAKLLLNAAKDGIRNVQNRYIKNVDQENKLSIDFQNNLKVQLTAYASKMISEAEDMYKIKEKELLAS